MVYIIIIIVNIERKRVALLEYVPIVGTGLAGVVLNGREVRRALSAGIGSVVAVAGEKKPLTISLLKRE